MENKYYLKYIFFEEIMGNNYYIFFNGEGYHVGLSSGGWRFQWNFEEMLKLMKKFELIDFDPQEILDLVGEEKEMFYAKHPNYITHVVDLPQISEYEFMEKMEKLSHFEGFAMRDEIEKSHEMNKFLLLVKDKQKSQTNATHTLRNGGISRIEVRVGGLIGNIGEFM